VHSVIFSYVGGADQGPNPIPTGTWVGFFYETDTIGTAIYIDGTTINYRREVPIASVTNNSVNPTLLRSIETARTTRGAFYNITQFNSTARVTQLFESFSEIIKDNLTLA
jgi:hypothetical protein